MSPSKEKRPAEKKPTTGLKVIVDNKRVRRDFFIEDRLEAGLVLEGWEVKSLRAGRGQLKDSYVNFKDGEAWLLSAHISPLPSASTHVQPNPQRARKLLLNRMEMSRLVGAVERRGYTVVPTRLYWRRGRVKVEVGTAKGKKQYDKRATEKARDWQREKERLLKGNRE